MELTYRLTRDDYSKYFTQVQARFIAGAGASVWKQVVAALPVPVTLLLTLAGLIGFTESGLIDKRAYAAACIAYVWGLASVEILRWIARRRLRRANWLPDDSSFRDTRLTVDGDGVVGSDSVSTSRYSWRAFSDVTEQAGLILLWMDRGACVIVPTRALADHAARRDFVTLARERIAQR